MADSPSEDDMTDLIERLEKAEEGSRELDAEIAVAIRSRETAVGKTIPEWADKNFPTWRARSGRVEVVHEDGTGGLHWRPPHYTTSLDAALALIPKNWGFVLGGPWPSAPGDSPLWQASVNKTIVDAARRTPDEWGNTPALALCIAALKARKPSNDEFTEDDVEAVARAMCKDNTVNGEKCPYCTDPSTDCEDWIYYVQGVRTALRILEERGFRRMKVWTTE